MRRFELSDGAYVELRCNGRRAEVASFIKDSRMLKYHKIKHRRGAWAPMRSIPILLELRGSNEWTEALFWLAMHERVRLKKVGI